VGLADYPFNDEFLFSQQDRDAERTLYPAVFAALDHAELRDAFQAVDLKAKAAMRRSRAWGCIAIAAAFLGLAADKWVQEPLIRCALAIA
jgi:hypothetical protein